MAIPVASPTAILPSPTPAAAPATGATRPAGAESPFQAALTAATQTQQTLATDATNDATATSAVSESGEFDAELDAELDPTLAVDASLAGLLAFATQVLAPPVNEAVAQATGQTARTESAAEVPVAVVPEARTRADQLRLDRGSGFLSTTTALPNSPVDAPLAASRAPAAPLAANAPPTVPVAAEPTLATAATVPSVATFATRPGGGSSIPAQGQIVANVIPNVPVPTGLSVTTPPVGEPTAAIPATALPGTQLGDRPTMAGDRFAADADAGARLVLAAPPSSVVFANTLAQEITEPLPFTAPPVAVVAAPPVAGSVPPVEAPVADAAPVTRVGPITAGQPTLPVSPLPAPGAANVTNEPAPVVNLGRPVVANTPPDARAARPLPTGTEVNFGRLVADTAVLPVQPPARNDESRPADDATVGTTSALGPQFAPPVVARGAVIETTAVRATPAAQIADSIVTHARVVERDGGVEFQMRLDPPELGRLQIRLMTRGDEIHGQVLVADEAVRGLIESQLPELRQRLEAAGVNVQRFDVSADPDTGGSRNPYRETVPEFAPRAPIATAAPRARVGRPDAGSLDVTV